MPRQPSKQWIRREKLREKGQFWTPPWVAEAMVTYVTRDAEVVFDPAFGAGAFAVAGKTVSAALNRKIRFAGCELHAEALEQAGEAGVGAADLRRVKIADFLLLSALPRGANIIANPPYIRHHRLGAALKSRLQRIAVENIGRTLDGRTGIHVFFLIRALGMLRAGGALAFILPSDVCEGVFARTLWEWIGRRFRIEAVVTFDPSATPFPGVDTNPVVLMIRNLPPERDFNWARIKSAGSDAFLNWVGEGMPPCSTAMVHAERRDVKAGLRAGVSRRVQLAQEPEFKLGDFVRVMRGVATGANEFFCLTLEQAESLKIPAQFLVRAVGRTRDVPGDEVRVNDLDALDREGRSTYLLALDGRPKEELPQSVQRYLTHGEQLGFPERSLIAQRRPWYKMERRVPPPFLFAYLGRRNARFIANRAGAWPLTGFLCVYPRTNERRALGVIEELLGTPELIAGLDTVAKSYGSGALKVEPRALERLAVPVGLVRRLELDRVIPKTQAAPKEQMALTL